MYKDGCVWVATAGLSSCVGVTVLNLLCDDNRQTIEFIYLSPFCVLFVCPVSPILRQYCYYNIVQLVGCLGFMCIQLLSVWVYVWCVCVNVTGCVSSCIYRDWGFF